MINLKKFQIFEGCPNHLLLDTSEDGTKFAEKINEKLKNSKDQNLILNLTGGAFYFDYIATSIVFDEFFSHLSRLDNSEKKQFVVFISIRYSSIEAYIENFFHYSKSILDFNKGEAITTEVLEKFCEHFNISFSIYLRSINSDKVLQDKDIETPFLVLNEQ